MKFYYTYFNRLNLLTYPNKDTLKEAITFILNSKTFYYGIK